MKRRGIISFVLCLYVIAAFTGTAQAQETVDLVVLLDSSQSMFQYYDEVVEFVITGIVSEYLRFGDAFHLISFAENTQIEIAQTVRTEQDIRTALARLYLLYPFGKNTDIITALRNTYQYINDLPQSNRKFLVLITDGMHAPGSSSPFASLRSDEVSAEIARTAGRFREKGWLIRIIQVPFKEASPGETATADTAHEDLSSPGAGNYLAELADSLGSSPTSFEPDRASETVSAVIKLPGFNITQDLGRQRYTFKLPVSVSNEAQEDISMEITGLIADGRTDILTDRAIIKIPAQSQHSFNLKVRVPRDWPTGTVNFNLEPRFADNLRVNPASTSVTVDLYTSAIFDFFDNTLTVLVFALLLVIAATIVIIALLIGRSIHRRADGSIVETVMDTSNPVGTNTKPVVSSSSDKPFAASVNRSASVLASAGGSKSVSTLASEKTVQPMTLASQQPSKATNIQAISGEKSTLTLFSTNTKSDKVDPQLLAGWSSSKPSARQELSERKTPLGKPASSQISHPHAIQIVKPGTIRVEFVVEGQNRAIGRRNIKTLHAGAKKTIGGASRDDFWAFLVPVAHTIAEVYFDGSSLKVIPRRTGAFPRGDQAFAVEFGEPFEFQSKKGRLLSVHFEYYTPPTERLNKLLHCIEVPGINGLIAASQSENQPSEG